MEANYKLGVFKDPNFLLNEYSALNYPGAVAQNRHQLWHVLEQVTRCIPENPSVITAKESVKANADAR
jgi:hypothetical protein